MTRRTLLRWAAATVRIFPIPALRSWCQTATFPAGLGPTLRELAAVVLPSELGAAGLERVATEFEQWVRDYRAGADMDHGYGLTRVRSKTTSPASTYIAQLEALREPLANRDNVRKRHAIEAAIEQANIKDLPRTPDGRHVSTDLMSFYFRGSDANDLCYRAAIRRDSCRGLEGSENPPPPLHGAA